MNLITTLHRIIIRVILINLKQMIVKAINNNATNCSNVIDSIQINYNSI